MIVPFIDDHVIRGRHITGPAVSTRIVGVMMMVLLGVEFIRLMTLAAQIIPFCDEFAGMRLMAV